MLTAHTFVVRPISRSFPSCKTETLHSLNNNFPLSRTSAPGKFYFLFLRVSLFSIPHVGGIMLSVFLSWSIPLFAEHNVWKVHPSCSILQDFLQVSATFHCVYTPIYFLHLSTDEHLGSFHLSPILNNAAMKWQCRYLFKVLPSVLLDIYPEVGLLGHIVPFFQGNSTLFFIAAASFYIPANSTQGFQCLLPLANSYFLVF